MLQNDNEIKGSSLAQILETILSLLWAILTAVTGKEQPGLTPPPLGEPLLDENGKQGWDNLVRLIKEDNSRAEHFNVAFLAQCILESGRGSSALAKEHKNYAGLKWRTELEGVATPVAYRAHDGNDTYCKFATDATFVKGYWLFIQRKPYKGWEMCETAEAYIAHLKKAGYAQDANYVAKVSSLFEEARGLLQYTKKPKAQDGIKPDLKITGVLVIKRPHTKAAPGASMVNNIGPNEWNYYGEKGEVIKMAQDYAAVRYPNLKVPEVLRDGLSIGNAYKQRVKAQNPTGTIEPHYNAAENASAAGTETLHSNEAMDKLFAQCVQNRLCEALGRNGSSRGLKQITTAQNGGTAVYALPGIPNCLPEPAFGSNVGDAKLLMERREAIAIALIEGYADYVRLKG